jgi:tetratricopeptide (TPR) repeat protein
MVGAIVYRKRAALWSFAILWFFTAHLLESTIIPIELYFEHRNYLPMLGIVIAFSYWVVQVSGKLKNTVYTAAVLLLCFEAGISHLSSQVWGNRGLIANVWAHEHPSSMRAQLDTIKYWLSRGNIDEVKDNLNRAIDGSPDNAGMRLYRFVVNKCNHPKLDSIGGSFEELAKVIPDAIFEHASIESIKFLADNISNDRCNTTPEEVNKIIDLYLSNYKFFNVSAARGALYQAKSKLYLLLGDLDKTIAMLDLTYEATPNYGFALNQAYLLASAGLHDDALRYVEKARHTKPYTRFMGLWQQSHIDEIEKFILLNRPHQ